MSLNPFTWVAARVKAAVIDGALSGFKELALAAGDGAAAESLSQLSGQPLPQLPAPEPEPQPRKRGGKAE